MPERRASQPCRCARATLIVALLAGAAAPARAETTDQAGLSILPQAQTQAFSEAGQSGDATTIARMLDPALVFTNESGDIANRQDIVDGTQPPPAGTPKRRVKVTDWVLHTQGNDLATATFVDQVSTDVAGQTLVLRFQSTETWIRRADGWVG